MKRLIKAILWIVCYGGACWIGFKAKFGFDILSQKHWLMLFDRSAIATWPSGMAERKMLCKILLAFILVGILGLAVVSKKKKERKSFVVSKAELSQKGEYRPAPLASQGRIAAPAPPANMTFQAPPKNAPSAPNLPSAAPAISASDMTHLNLMEETIKKISNVANNFDLSIFPHVKLENTFTQLVVSDDSNALLLKILPQSGTWQVQPNPNPSESVWILNGQNPQNLLRDIIKSTQTLARLEPDANAVSVVILTNSTLEKPEEVKEFLMNNDIQIVTLLPDNQTIPGIQTWQELLAEFYPLKTKEENNETNNNP